MVSLTDRGVYLFGCCPRHQQYNRFHIGSEIQTKKTNIYYHVDTKFSSRAHSLDNRFDQLLGIGRTVTAAAGRRWQKLLGLVLAPDPVLLVLARRGGRRFVGRRCAQPNRGLPHGVGQTVADRQHYGNVAGPEKKTVNQLEC